jgi:glycogen debranching enzyme
MSNQQPFLHDLLITVCAPAQVLCRADGQIDPAGATGVYLSDRRVLSEATVVLTPGELAPVRSQVVGASTTRALSVVRGLGDVGADPSVTLEQIRTVGPSSVRETLTLRSVARTPVSTTIVMALGCDLAEMADIKAGHAPGRIDATATSAGLQWRGSDGTTVQASFDPPPNAIDARTGVVRWNVELRAGDHRSVGVAVTATGDPVAPVLISVRGGGQLARPQTHSGDPRLAALVEQSVQDLFGLEAADPADPADHFMAAGAPWFFTLFGRDSLLAARMLLPLGTEVAAGTLRILARYQGRKVDIETAEEPGKILHELRRAGTEERSAQPSALPPAYYGTIDATPLWIMLLHDAWRWGLAADEVRRLLPNLQAALGWLRDYGLHANGFLSYVDESGRGLANQGWKDSGDSIQFNDGTLAKPPVALSEVQGYAYAAAIGGAELLDSFGLAGGAEWRTWAQDLANRFRETFWIRDEVGPYPAIALDGNGTPVDAVASNMGHLLGTGLLSPAESAHVVARLRSPELSSGFGLRTMATSACGFNPLSYHGGSVWTHDTAMAISGLSAAAAEGVPGATEAAAQLIEGLLNAAPSFDYRMPELYAGDTFEPGRKVAPYPASCRPQAWSAASSIAIVAAVLGLRPDVPNGTVVVDPLRPSPVGRLSVRGLRVAGETFDVSVTDNGEPTVHTSFARLAVKQVMRAS